MVQTHSFFLKFLLLLYWKNVEITVYLFGESHKFEGPKLTPFIIPLDIIILISCIYVLRPCSKLTFIETS